MSIKCPDCSSDNIKDEGDGIMSCKSCDLIFDAGPQWIRYNPENSIKGILRKLEKDDILAIIGSHYWGTIIQKTFKNFIV